jgi:alpha 1,3-mannosyltransferase
MGWRVLSLVALTATLLSLYLGSSFYRPQYHVVEQSTFAILKNDYESNPVKEEDFGLLGRRLQILRGYLEEAEDMSGPATHLKPNTRILEIEELLASMFPYLKGPSQNNTMPLRSLRSSFVLNSRGIVIPMGFKQFRSAAHLIATLKGPIQTKLPITIAYAGEEDLPSSYRGQLASLGSVIEFLDLTTIFDDSQLQLRGSHASKPFALLACKYEEIVLLDPETVVLRDPAGAFDFTEYKTTGTFLFHDRLRRQEDSRSLARRVWWKNQTLGHTPSTSYPKHWAWTGGYVGEQDSGMVVYDKRKAGLLIALLHICWQKTVPVREKVTLELANRGRDSWWLGLELCGVEYAFEDAYGSAVGKYEGNSVCSLNVGHLDASNPNRLFWYSGGLLKTKVVGTTDFLSPDVWMNEGHWEQDSNRQDDALCLVEGDITKFSKEQTQVMEKIIEAAKVADQKFAVLIEGQTY